MPRIRTEGEGGQGVQDDGRATVYVRTEGGKEEGFDVRRDAGADEESAGVVRSSMGLYCGDCCGVVNAELD